MESSRKARCFRYPHPERHSGALLTFLLLLCLFLFSSGCSKAPDNTPNENSAGASEASEGDVITSSGPDQKPGESKSDEEKPDGNESPETAVTSAADTGSTQELSASADTENSSSSETVSAETASAGISSTGKAAMETALPDQSKDSSGISSTEEKAMETALPDQDKDSSESASAEEADSISAASSTPHMLEYIDAWQEWHTMEVDPAVKECIYDPELFFEEDGLMTYKDDRYEVLQGVDVSEHQGYIDWDAVARAGYSFAFIRVGYRGYGEAGNLYEDATAVDNLRRAKAAGLRVGTYIFSQALNEDEARAEADLAVGMIMSSGVETDLPLMYDPELIKDDWGRANEITREQASLNTAAFKDQVEKISTLTTDIYSNLPWEHNYFDTDTMNQFEIWYADYEKKPQTPYHFTWWQYTNQGYVPGISGRVDLNLWLRPKDTP